MAQLEAFAEARRINLNEMKNIVRSLLTVLRGALRKNLLPKSIGEDLATLGARTGRTSERVPHAGLTPAQIRNPSGAAPPHRPLHRSRRHHHTRVEQ